MKKYTCITIVILATAFLLVACNYNNGYAATEPNSGDSSTDVEAYTDPHPNRSHLKNTMFATPENPVVSPSGEFEMYIVSGFNGGVYDNCFVVHKNNETNEVFFESDKFYRTRDKLRFMWDKDDNIWVYSGDIGITFWLKQDNIWIEDNYDSESVPDILK